MSSKEQYLHEVATTAIIVKDNKFLITKRSEKREKFPSKWTVPGGRLQKNDCLSLPKDIRSMPGITCRVRY